MLFRQSPRPRRGVGRRAAQTRARASKVASLTSHSGPGRGEWQQEQRGLSPTSHGRLIRKPRRSEMHLIQDSRFITFAPLELKDCGPQGLSQKPVEQTDRNSQGHGGQARCPSAARAQGEDTLQVRTESHRDGTHSQVTKQRSAEELESRRARSLSTAGSNQKPLAKWHLETSDQQETTQRASE